MEYAVQAPASAVGMAVKAAPPHLQPQLTQKPPPPMDQNVNIQQWHQQLIEIETEEDQVPPMGQHVNIQEWQKANPIETEDQAASMSRQHAVQTLQDAVSTLLDAVSTASAADVHADELPLQDTPSDILQFPGHQRSAPAVAHNSTTVASGAHDISTAVASGAHGWSIHGLDTTKATSTGWNTRWSEQQSWGCWQGTGNWSSGSWSDRGSGSTQSWGRPSTATERLDRLH